MKKTLQLILTISLLFLFTTNICYARDLNAGGSGGSSIGDPFINDLSGEAVYERLIYDGSAWINEYPYFLTAQDGNPTGSALFINNDGDVNIGGGDLDIGTGGLLDNNVIVAIPLGDASNTSFNTTLQNIVGAVNEVNSSIPKAVEDNPVVTNNGDTVFTLSSSPSGPAALSVYLNGQLRLRSTDYTQTGTTITWLDPGGVTLVTPDVFIARYNDVAGGGNKVIFLSGTNYDGNEGNYRIKALAATGAQRFAFYMPDELNSIVSFKAIGIVSAGAAGASRDIDLSSDYGTIGEASNQHTESDTGSTYDYTGKSGQLAEVLDLTAVLSLVSAGDYMGIFIDHKGIGGSIDYIGFKLVYN